MRETLTVSSDSDSDPAVTHRIVCHLDAVLLNKGMTLTELSARTGITMANLSILKNNRAKAIRFTSLTLICDALGATPQELFSIAHGPGGGEASA